MPRLPLRLALIALAVPLAACSDSGDATAEKGAMPDVNISAKGKNGEDVTIKANKDDRRVSINAGEFSMNVKVPDWVDLSGKSAMDIDGVGLPAGATVTGVSVLADERVKGPAGAKVDVRFDAPMNAAAAADWYAKALADKSIAVTRKGTTINGQSSDGSPFVITLTDKGAGSQGHITLTEMDSPGP